MSDEEQIKIKDYQIHLPPLGEGAFGKVYRATYRGISDRALKIFLPGAVDLATMARELEKLSKVAEHQGIVTLHDFDVLNSPPYYAMGLHADQSANDGWETRTLERLCGHIDHREGWRLIRDTSDALAYLHRHQIIHCDIKPSNILLTDETPVHIKICDFGQSRGLATEGFQAVGTPLYASPEQLRNPRDSADGKGFRWDVYSFGVVAYKLLTGELPRLQGFADAERKSGFDPESTLHEASLEATLAETGNPVDGEQLATLTEAVETISWPPDFYVPSARKELIEQCLSLDPHQRPADMREVATRIEQLDQQRVVRRARRLNTIFATLLVVAIWASGFAFVQARKAKKATEEAIVAQAEFEKSAGAAVDLMLLLVRELDQGDFSGEGKERLSAIVADNASTFLETRFKDRDTSARVLRFSAQTAAIRGRRALKKGNTTEALKDFTNAFEIRSQLADDSDAPSDLGLLASRDLMEIGRINEALGNYDEAIEAYAEALEWRSQTAEGEGIFSLQQIDELAGSYLSLSRVHFLNDDVRDALSTLEEILDILDRRIEDGVPSEVPAFAIEAIRILNQKAAIEYESENLDAASATYQDLMVLANSMEEGPPALLEEAQSLYIKAVHTLGMIQLAQKQPEAALILFREEIKLREDITKVRPYEEEQKIALAQAYAKAAESLDTTNPTSLSLAVFYLEQARSLLIRLPSSIRARTDVQTRMEEYELALKTLLPAP